MNDFNSLFDNAAFVVNFILSLILLIVFLRLAWNVGKIKKHITGSSAHELEKMAEKAVFKGNREEAMSAYLDAIYVELHKADSTSEERRGAIVPIIKKIVEIGGQLPPVAMKEIKSKLNIDDISKL